MSEQGSRMRLLHQPKKWKDQNREAGRPISVRRRTDMILQDKASVIWLPLKNRDQRHTCTRMSWQCRSSAMRTIKLFSHLCWPSKIQPTTSRRLCRTRTITAHHQNLARTRRDRSALPWEAWVKRAIRTCTSLSRSTKTRAAK